MPFDPGPLPGKGFQYDMGAGLHVGAWVTSTVVGDMLEVGYNVGQGWVIYGTAFAPGDDGAWQNYIDVNFGGKIGVFYLNFIMPRINNLLAEMVEFQPHPEVIGNTDPYSKHTMEALMFEYTEVYVKPDGDPAVRFKPYQP